MHATERLQEISEKILNQTRTDLYLSLHFLGESLDALPWQMDLSTTGIGTDAEFIRYNPRFLMQTYLQEPKWMARTYLHIVLHCLLLHPMAEIPRIVVDMQANDPVDSHAADEAVDSHAANDPGAPVSASSTGASSDPAAANASDNLSEAQSGGDIFGSLPANATSANAVSLLQSFIDAVRPPKSEPDRILWNLACDIAVESIIDSLEDCPAVSRVLPDFRAEWYEKLGAEMKVLTAEKIYRYLMQNPPDPITEEKLINEFTLCDHEFWEELENRKKDSSGKKRNAGEDENDDSNRDEESDDPDRDSEEEDDESDRDEETDDPDRDSEKENDESDRDEENSPEQNPDDQESIMESLQQELNRKRREELEKSWQDKSNRMMAELENTGSRMSRMTGTLTRILEVQNRKRMSYRDFLRRYAVVREEARVDPDSFDYGFYNYGMELYGNMPLMEENEYRESRKIEELVIVIDTSASCQASLVQHFLNETAAILRSRETFFHRIELRILECDNQVQKDILIRSPEEMKGYLETFEVSGGFGTDFRPAFEYVEELRAEGHLKNLRGLLYYTDGAGIYPSRPTTYETTFVFRSDENFFERHVPDWCVKVYLGEDDRIEFAGKH